MLLRIIKYFMAYHYALNTRYSYESGLPYKMSAYLAVFVILCYVDAFLILSYPILYFIYDLVINVYVIAFGFPIILVIVSPFFRRIITEDELKQYAETLDKKKLKLSGDIHSWLCLGILFLSIYIYVNYLIDVKVPYFFLK
jgi:hypothetical protein